MTEKDYLAQLSDAVTEAQWGRIIERAMADAEQGERAGPGVAFGLPDGQADRQSTQKDGHRRGHCLGDDRGSHGPLIGPIQEQSN